MLLSSHKKNKIQQTLFIAGYLVWLIWKLITMSMFSFPDGSWINTALHGAMYLLLVGSIFCTNEFDSQTIMFIFSLALGILVKIYSDEILIIDLVLLFYASRGTGFNSIARVTLYTLSIYACLVMLSSLVGIIPNYHFSRGDSIRYGLGFRYTTYASHFFLGISLLYYYLQRKKVSIVGYATIISIGFIIYILTNSRNSFYLTLMITAGSIAYKYMSSDSKVSKVLKITALGSFAALACLALALSLAYDSSSGLWKSANQMLSGRLTQTHASLIKYGVSPFGQKNNLVGRSLEAGGGLDPKSESIESADLNYIDCAYLNIAVEKGWVTAGLFVGALTLTAAKAVRDNDIMLCYILLIIAVHLFFDIQFSLLYYNAFLFLAWKSSCEVFNKYRKKVFSYK